MALSVDTAQDASVPDDGAATLLRRAGRGDQEAFAEWYDLTAAQVYGRVLHRLGDTQTCTRVLQEIYCDAWTAAPQFSAGDDPHAWLWAIARRRTDAVSTRRRLHDLFDGLRPGSTRRRVGLA